MFTTHRARTLRAALALPAVALAGFGVAAATSAADPSDASARHHGEQQRLVARGEATIADSPCPAGLCLELQDGTFRGTPVGTGAYGGSIELLVAETFPNGEGGICAPMRGEIVLGQGSPDRLVLAVDGDSCQDGAGDPTTTSFTGLARFTVKHGTGTYAKASGSGLATFSEDAADQDRMTLIGSISR